MKKRKLRIGIVDLVARTPGGGLYGKLMHANLASVMPQVVATWCERDGHDVQYVCYTGFEELQKILPEDVDIVFIAAFTEAAQMAYALSNYFRSKDAVTVLGGAHARCYPEDSRHHFDYVLGFTDRAILGEVLTDCSQHRPIGLWMAATRQPTSLPGVRERWKYIEQTLQKAPWIKVVPMLASLGCPYTCSFCIDAEVPYQSLDYGTLRDDLGFLKTKFKRPLVAWHDPNFGVRFQEMLDVIEESVPVGSIDFIAESSLSLLSESNVKRLSRNGFKAILPGIESWFDLGNKSKTGLARGQDKVRSVAEHIRMIQRHIPYVQTNFVLGLDADEGLEPFELTKRFVDLTPAAFPGYSLLSAFGRAAPLNLMYQRTGRVLPFPFHLLNNNQAMNVKPKNYAWAEFYDQVVGLVEHTFSLKAIANRFVKTRKTIPRLMNVVRAISSEGWGRLKYYREIRRRLDTDRQFRPYFEGTSSLLPQFFRNLVQRDLGEMWRWLPGGALDHDSQAYLKAEEQSLRPTTVAASV